MNDSIFGTDGIRGIYGQTLTEQTAYALGACLGRRGNILIGADNRPSSPLLAAAVAKGASSAKGDILYLGAVTTPALYHILTQTNYDFGVMITASHNPPAYNGLKVFTRDGKLPAETRRILQEEMRQIADHPGPFPLLAPCPDGKKLYEDFLLSSVGSLKGMRVVVDFARGAGSAFHDLLSQAGAEVIPLCLSEKGDAINEGCGALHPHACMAETLRCGADLGLALDGDGDRLIAVTKDGEILDGDAIAFLFACRMKARGILKQDKVALTVMTNSGVLKSLSDRGIGALSCAVGDAAVAAAMRAEGLNLGGEQSGHIILGDHLMTGDGLLVGAFLMKSLLEEGPLREEERPLRYPQILLNIPVRDRSVAYDPAVQSLAASLKSDFLEGRISVRASGTEEVVRVMTEHPDEEKAREAAERLKQEILARA